MASANYNDIIKTALTEGIEGVIKLPLSTRSLRRAADELRERDQDALANAIDNLITRKDPGPAAVGFGDERSYRIQRSGKRDEARIPTAILDRPRGTEVKARFLKDCAVPKINGPFIIIVPA